MWCRIAVQRTAETSTYTVPCREAAKGVYKQNFPAFHTRKERGLMIVYSKPKDSAWYHNVMRLG
jgi:hypothetical protein